MVASPPPTSTANHDHNKDGQLMVTSFNQLFDFLKTDMDFQRGTP